jgi:hypothetical protein
MEDFYVYSCLLHQLFIKRRTMIAKQNGAMQMLQKSGRSAKHEHDSTGRTHPEMGLYIIYLHHGQQGWFCAVAILVAYLPLG